MLIIAPEMQHIVFYASFSMSDVFLYLIGLAQVISFYFMVDCKINPNAVRTKKISFFKMVFTTNPSFRADLLSSITYSERIKIETFCELGLSNIQMGVRLNRSPSTNSYELSRCQPYQADLANYKWI
ncbi:hypothetical protein CJP55_14810 [Lactobacillus plantarum]|nr:hypothetical protein [Lactiplantibacillus plantarum]